MYPAAALRSWGLMRTGYKGLEGRENRARLVEGVEGVMPWLDWNGFREECIRSDDVLDAVLSALVTREAAKGRTRGPGAADRPIALSEGWIHVPDGGSHHRCRGPVPSSASSCRSTR